MAKTINIYVSRIGSSTQLSLRDDDNTPGVNHDPLDDSLITDVEAGDTIQWQVDPNPPFGRSNDITITAITKSDPVPGKYQNSQQLLTANPPSPTPPSTTWVGTVVSPSPGAGKLESYSVSFTKNADPNPKTTYQDDPKLIMK